MKGHKDSSGKFHPHSSRRSGISSKWLEEVHNAEIKKSGHPENWSIGKPRIKDLSNKKHVHRLQPYWGGYYCTTPDCTVKKYKKMKGKMKING